MRTLVGPEPSRLMKEILGVIRGIALSDLVVLIVGECGTEKEWLAKKVHEMSGRSAERFVSLDCSNLDHDSMAQVILGHEDLTLTGVEINKGILEAASGGTLLLDNITALSPDVLRRIAGSIEHQQFRRVGGSQEVMTRVRFILGVCKSYDSNGEDQRVEKEISNRVCPVIVNLPPLRDRKEDIAILIKEFMSESQETSARQPLSMSDDAMRICTHYDWPGNAQELKMVIEHSVKLCPGNVIQEPHLPEYLREANMNTPANTIGTRAVC